MDRFLWYSGSHLALHGSLAPHCPEHFLLVQLPSCTSTRLHLAHTSARSALPVQTRYRCQLLHPTPTVASHRSGPGAARAPHPPKCCFAAPGNACQACKSTLDIRIWRNMEHAASGLTPPAWLVQPCPVHDSEGVAAHAAGGWCRLAASVSSAAAGSNRQRPRWTPMTEGGVEKFVEPVTAASAASSPSPQSICVPSLLPGLPPSCPDIIKLPLGEFPSVNADKQLDRGASQPAPGGET